MTTFLKHFEHVCYSDIEEYELIVVSLRLLVAEVCLSEMHYRLHHLHGRLSFASRLFSLYIRPSHMPSRDPQSLGPYKS